MSVRELQRVEVMARMAKEDLRLLDAATLLGLSYPRHFLGSYKGLSTPPRAGLSPAALT